MYPGNNRQPVMAVAMATCRGLGGRGHAVLWHSVKWEEHWGGGLYIYYIMNQRGERQRMNG